MKFHLLGELRICRISKQNTGRERRMGARKIAGEWRGRYQYLHSPIPNRGCGFTAFVYERADNAIDGTIIDDSDTPSATLSGSFQFPSVQFTKQYSKAGEIHEIEKQGDKIIHLFGSFGPPVDYVGSMNDDGKSMNGTWSIYQQNEQTGGVSMSSGTWIAYRVEEEETKKEATTKAEKVRETEDQLI
jgi:hypothetical protein